MRKLLREPLVHFLILGVVLFLVFDFAGKTDPTGTRRIVVTAGQVEQLAAQFSRTWLRPPTPSELKGLVESYVRSEVFYREALAMGLGQNDPYVRNRLKLKLEFLLENVSAEAEPTDGVLARFLERHIERFAQPARLSFRQVYLNPDRHPDPAAVAERLLDALRAGADIAGLGDPSMLASSLGASTRSETARQFGDDFADAVAELEPGVWSGPVHSPYGMHLVLVTKREPGRHPALAEIRDAVLAEWRDERRQEAREQVYQRLRERYEIVMEPGAAGRSPAGSGVVRTAQGGGAAAAAPARAAPEASPGVQ
jgi:hypothetical protein